MPGECFASLKDNAVLNSTGIPVVPCQVALLLIICRWPISHGLSMEGRDRMLADFWLPSLWQASGAAVAGQGQVRCLHHRRVPLLYVRTYLYSVPVRTLSYRVLAWVLARVRYLALRIPCLAFALCACMLPSAPFLASPPVLCKLIHSTSVPHSALLAGKGGGAPP